MMRDQLLSVVTESARAARVPTPPYPLATADGQLLFDHEAVIVEEVRPETPAHLVISDDLDPAGVALSHTAVGLVHDKRCPGAHS